MSRFADPTATATVSLGACQCPGTPHEQDEALVRLDLGGSALARIDVASRRVIIDDDPLAQYRQVAVETVMTWNILDDDGDRIPILPRTFAEMDAKTLSALVEGTDALIAERNHVPNPSGAPSVASPRRSASRTRTPTRKPGT